MPERVLFLGRVLHVDELVLIFSAVAAVASSISVYFTWWGTERSSAHIQMVSDDEIATIKFFNMGSRPLLLPRVEVFGAGMISTVPAEDRNILRLEDDPITLTIPIRSAQQADGLVASIEWTESGRRTPKLRGLRWVAGSRQLLVLSRRQKWISLSKRQIVKIQGRYSQI